MLKQGILGQLPSPFYQTMWIAQGLAAHVWCLPLHPHTCLKALTLERPIQCPQEHPKFITAKLEIIKLNLVFSSCVPQMERGPKERKKMRKGAKVISSLGPLQLVFKSKAYPESPQTTATIVTHTPSTSPRVSEYLHQEEAGELVDR